ncbi:MAG TPA: DegT/DnrJ/EryC1/StrS family aminotransferase [Thermoanaerobaculia bacterium]|nr:DegT/DnrJ/EryC1/StrS family aminotransferase [Thermoanaerobaculia bacterium]
MSEVPSPAASRAPFAEPIYVGGPLLPPLEVFVARLEEVWRSRWLTNGGAQHAELEARLRDELGTPSLLLFNNGTMALLAACRALHLEGEVLTTPFTFPATTHVLAWSGLDPVFCDVDPATMNLDPERLESRITPRTRAILAVHVYGTPCEVAALQEIADRHGLKVIYDAAHAFGVRVDGRGIGSFGDASAFSFHATKLFHTAEGGALACRDPAVADEAALLRNFGIRDEQTVELPGLNGKLSEVHAALGLAVLDALPEERRHRRELADGYREELSGLPGLGLPAALPEGSVQYFVVRVDGERFGCTRDELHLTLRAANVFARRYFYPLCSESPAYRRLPSADPRQLPEAHRAAREVLCLPLHSGVSLEQVRAISRVVRGAAG